MLISRECDYALRIVRALSTGKKISIAEISSSENISKQFAYKIAKKLEKNNILASHRGVNGGYSLVRDINNLTIYDIVIAIDEEFFITDCTSCNYQCSQNLPSSPCGMHFEFCRIQKLLMSELKSKSIAEILINEAFNS